MLIPWNPLLSASRRLRRGVAKLVANIVERHATAKLAGCPLIAAVAICLPSSSRSVMTDPMLAGRSNPDDREPILVLVMPSESLRGTLRSRFGKVLRAINSLGAKTGVVFSSVAGDMVSTPF